MCSRRPEAHQGHSEVSSNNNQPWPASSKPSEAVMRRGGHQGLFAGPALFPAQALLNIRIFTSELENQMRLGLAVMAI